MTKETEDFDDKAGNEGVREPTPDTSIRGSIRAAVDEIQGNDNSREPDEKDTRRENAQDKAEKPERAQAKSTENVRDTGKGERERDNTGKFKSQQTDASKSSVEPEVKDEQKKVSSPPTEQLKPPVGWTKEGKTAWETLPPDVQKSVLKREEEFSNGIKQYADKAKAFEELDQVIAPYKQMISQFGVTPVQTVAKLFEWMHALGQPSQEYKAMAFRMLADQFQFDISNLAPRAKMTEENDDTLQFDPRIIDQTLNQRLQPIQQELATFKQMQEEESRRVAAAQLADWSKDKPYYERVKQTMHRLFTSGEVPIVGNNLDLDTAYNKAIRLHDDVWAEIQAEAQQKAAQEAQEKAEREAKEKAERFARKQNLSVGVRPSAPTMPSAGIQPRKPANNKEMTVRDSLRASLQEIREGTS